MSSFGLAQFVLSIFLTIFFSSPIFALLYPLNKGIFQYLEIFTPSFSALPFHGPMTPNFPICHLLLCTETALIITTIENTNFGPNVTKLLIRIGHYWFFFFFPTAISLAFVISHYVWVSFMGHSSLVTL